MAITKQLSIPANWEALTDTQLKDIATLLYSNPNKKQFAIKALHILINPNNTIKKNKLLGLILSNYRLEDLKPHIAFLYKDTNRKTFIKEIHINDTYYIAPQPFLFNISIYEFSIADDFYMRFRKAKTRKDQLMYLRYMAAVLYVPESSSPKRPVFYLETIEQLVQPFNTCNTKDLYAMLVAYQGCRFLLEKRYKKVFKSAAGTPKGPTKNYGFGKVILEMAGGKFGDHQTTKQTLLHTFLEQWDQDLTKK